VSLYAFSVNRNRKQTILQNTVVAVLRSLKYRVVKDKIQIT